MRRPGSLGSTRSSTLSPRGSAEVRVDVMAVPKDCSDGFGEAFFARPEAFLRPEVRAATSGLVLTDPEAVQLGLDRLEEDLASGAWDQSTDTCACRPSATVLSDSLSPAPSPTLPAPLEPQADPSPAHR